MPAGEALTDDYVAEILKRNASSKPNRYPGDTAYGPLLSRGKSGAPKANTRFLRKIIRETDSHNAMLKARETAESRERFRRLERDRSVKDRFSAQRRDGNEVRRGVRDAERAEKKDPRRDSENRESSSSKTSKPRRERRDLDRDDERKHYKRKRSDDRSRSPVRHDRRRSSRNEKTSRTRGSAEVRSADVIESEPDSDPLDAIIGPRPPPKTLPRGRGALKSSSMDVHFDPEYDPNADVALNHDDEGDDWDIALEALRDRTKWRKQGAERLRAAGFTDEEVRTWEKGGGRKRDDENDMSSVRWNKKGESREWDRGKTVNDDHIGVEPEWGRLKGT